MSTQILSIFFSDEVQLLFGEETIPVAVELKCDCSNLGVHLIEEYVQVTKYKIP